MGEKKIKAHMKVVILLDKKHSFGFFNKKNIPFSISEPVELSREEFDEIIRKALLADLSSNKHSPNNASNRKHKYKLKNGKAYRHVFHDLSTYKKINRNIAKLMRSKRRKK